MSPTLNSMRPPFEKAGAAPLGGEWLVAAFPAAGALFARFGLVHRQVAVTQLVSVEHADRLLGLGLSGHLHKGKAPGAACVTIVDQRDGGHGAGLREQSTQIVFGGTVRQIPDIQLDFHFVFSLRPAWQAGKKEPPSHPRVWRR